MKKENLWPGKLTAETLNIMKEMREKAKVAQEAARKFENEYLNHPEEPDFYGLDFGYPEAEKIIIAQLCESTGLPDRI